MDQPKINPMQAVLNNRNFRFLWIGQGTSLIGDQFYLIATPWMVLKLTNDPLALGAALALAGIPRAVFMLLGGAITDRFSPRLIMILSDILRLVLTASMALLALTGKMQVWMVYAFSFLFGLVSGFFLPASGSMVPRLVDPDKLQAGNSVIQGSQQLSIFLGPALAGGVIAFFTRSQPGAAPDLSGIGLAYIIDAVTFLVSIVTLWWMDSMPAGGAAATARGVLQSILDGIRSALRDPDLRTLFTLLTVINFLFSGPILVGIPVLASARLAEGAMAFGLIMSAYGGGNLGGIILAGSLPRLKPDQMRLLLTALVAGFGVAIFSFAFLTATPIAFGVMLILGLGNGYLGITMLSLLQRRTPREMLGRMMGMVNLTNLGLAPVSQAVAGLVLRFNLNALFISAGLLMVLSAVWMIGRPEVRQMMNVAA
jgi:MFS family permease